MSTDIIELGSSDDEKEPVPKKKKVMPNTMVRIPSHTKLPGVTIKPAKNKKGISYCGIKNTVTTPTISINQRQVGGNDSRNSLLKPILKKASTTGSFSNIINVVSLNPMGSKLLKKLPASITVKKSTASKTVSIPIKKAKLPKQVVLPVEINVEPILSSNPLPQWYKKPEDLESEINSMVSMEEKNNKESVKLVEITIDDSPVKVSTVKHTENTAITIEDSPLKGTARIKDDLKQKKEKQSKKMLNYENIKIVKDKTGMIEVEVDAIDINQIRNDPCGTQCKKVSHDDLPQPVKCVPQDKLLTKSIKENLNSKNASTIDRVEVIHEKKQKDDIETHVCNKEKETASGDGEFNPVYQKFINTCFHIENSNDMQYIVEKKIKSYYRQCPKEYVDSEEFLDLVSGKIMAIEASPNKMYLYIRDVVSELNIQRKMAKAGTSSKNETSAEYPANNIDTSECDTKRQRQIKKLEKTLTKLHRAIQKLEEQEIDFDEEDDSIYLLTERYKERFLRVHAKFCQLTQTKLPSEPYIKLETLPGRPKGPAARLEKWINKKVPIGKPLPFPDFHDVLRCVREANTEDKLGWSEMEILEEARELFTSCGKKLKRRRQENEWRIAASRLPVNEDPAENNVELKLKLDQNTILAKRNETEILNKYVDRQNQLKLVAEVIGDKEAEESPIESEEEEESNVIEIKEKEKVEKEVTNIEVDTESKDDSNLLQKLYSESDSDSPINLTDSDNEPSTSKVINSDVISIEDSSYSESESCINEPDESNASPVQMDFELSADSIVRHSESTNKEYLTVDITEDIQEILSTKNEIGKNTSAEALESPKECADNDDIIKMNENVVTINDSSNIETKSPGVNIEIVNVETVTTDESVSNKNSYELNNVEGKLKVKDTQECEKSIAPETTMRQSDVSNEVNVTSTIQLLDKDKYSTEISDIDNDVEMKSDDVATTDNSLNIDKNNAEIDVAKEHMDVEMTDAEIKPIDKHSNECKNSTEIERTKENNIETNKSKLDAEKISCTHTDFEMTDFHMTTDKQIDKDNIEMIKQIDLEKNDTINETNVKSTDQFIDTEEDNAKTAKTDSGADVIALQNFNNPMTNKTIDENAEKSNGDAEIANAHSDEPVNKLKTDSTMLVDIEISKDEVETNIETGIVKNCSDVQLNNVESEKTDHTIENNSIIISDICTKIIENIENVTNSNHVHEIVNSAVDTIKRQEVNTEKKQDDNFNKSNDCRNLENNSSIVETCSKHNTEVDNKTGKNHENENVN